MLFSRSKSRQRKHGAHLKNLIGNPVPIDPIRINGAFIDLRLEPQTGFPNFNVTPVIEIPPDSSLLSPNTPGPWSSNGTQERKFFVKNGTELLPTPPAFNESFSFDDPDHQAKSSDGRPSLDSRLPFHPPRPTTAGNISPSRNYSRPGDVTGTPSPHALPPSPYLPSPAFSYPDIAYYTNHEHIEDSPRSLSPVSKEEILLPDIEGLTATETFYRHDQRAQANYLTTPVEKKRSSSVYSGDSADSASFVPNHPTDKLAGDTSTYLPDQIFKYFESDPISPDSVSPLFVPPQSKQTDENEDHDKDKFQQRFYCNQSNDIPRLDTTFEKTNLEISFGNFEIDMDSNKRPSDDAEISPSQPAAGEKQQLSNLRRLDDVQRGAGELRDRMSATDDDLNEDITKKSLTRKVSTRLRDFVGGGNGNPASQFRNPPLHTPINKADISDPVPLPDSEKAPLDPRLEEMLAMFEVERGAYTAASKIEESHVRHPVDDWTYNQSASSSASNLSHARPSYDSPPGLTSHRSSTRSSDRNPAPDSPLTPADDSCGFDDLRSSQVTLGHTTKNSVPLDQQNFVSVTPTRKNSSSPTVPLFIDPSKDRGLPKFTHEPPTPEAARTSFNRQGTTVPDNEASRNDFDRKGSIVPEPAHFLRNEGFEPSERTEHTDDYAKPRTMLPSCRNLDESTHSTDISANIPQSPTNTVVSRASTIGRKAPFGPGGPKRMLLRSATMSSRQASASARPVKSAAEEPISEAVEPDAADEPQHEPPQQLRHVARRPTLRMATSDLGHTASVRAARGIYDDEKQSPASPHTRYASTYSHAPSTFLQYGDDSQAVCPDDSISQVGVMQSFTEHSYNNADQSLARQRSLRQARSFTNLRQSSVSSPKDNHRPLTATHNEILRRPSKTLQKDNFRRPSGTMQNEILRRPSTLQKDITRRPSTASQKVQNDRVAALTKQFDAPRPSTAGTPSGDLRLDTDVTSLATPADTSMSFTGEPELRSPRSAVDLTSTPTRPTFNRSKSSVGQGLRRAFSRRKVAPELTSSPTPPPEMRIAEEEEEESRKQTEVSGPLGHGPSSETSMARWNVAIRAAAASNALQRTASIARALRPQSTILKAQPLTPEDLERVHKVEHAPGTLFIRTCEFPEEYEDDEYDENGPVGECMEHRMKPRKGGVGRCAFCSKGPFANMWACIDDGCKLVICRMCCNEKVQAGEAELF